MLKEAGYTIKDAYDVCGISRSSYYSVKEVRVIEWAGEDIKEEGLIKRIKEIKAGHPFWGYRRVTAWLKHREGIKVNHKRVQRLLKPPELSNGVYYSTRTYRRTGDFQKRW